ncbi:transporter [Zoogloea sp. LCSB751]|uniref:transporter n=1 Tax=Zoogloea sp. LCSB751 TaxID=1965277 RepID=UPI000B496B9F|nr:transporter [Zoogloea sp. LCSB751]
MLPTDASYGSDRSGLISGFLFRPGAAGEALDTARATRWLSGAEVAHDGAFAWLHFNLANAATERWLQEHLGEVDAFFDALHEGSRSTRIEYAHDALIAVVNDVLYEFDFEPSQLATLWLYLDERTVISARLQPLRTIDRLREAVRQGETFDSTVAMLTHLLRDQADVLVQIVRTATDQVDDVEDTMLAERGQRSRARLGSLRRVLVRLRRLLAPEPGALFRLLNQPPRWIAADDLQDLRHSTEEFSAVLADMSALQERIKLLQEEVAARVTEETNRSVFVLTMVTVLALPINMIAGLLGMNVGGIPLADHPEGFWIVVAIIASFTVGAAWWAFRQNDE